MTKFEYNYLRNIAHTPYSETINKLNVLGKEGWDLVCYVGEIFVLKREIIEKTDNKFPSKLREFLNDQRLNKFGEDSE